MTAAELTLPSNPDVDPHWTDRALCAEVDPELFFPEKGGSTKGAKQTCRACEVRAECLEWALTQGEVFGVWGGTSERERRLLRKLKRTEVADTDLGVAA